MLPPKPSPVLDAALLGWKQRGRGCPRSKYKGIYFMGTRQRQHLVCVGLFPVTGLYIQSFGRGRGGQRVLLGPPPARGWAAASGDPPSVPPCRGCPSPGAPCERVLSAEVGCVLVLRAVCAGQRCPPSSLPFLIIFLLLFFLLLPCPRRGRDPRPSFPRVQRVLEFGAGVAKVETLLVDGVVRVEANHHRVSGRVNLLGGLRG